MDEQDIFNKLGFGIKFNTKRFKNDAQKLKLVSNNGENANHTQLDFFNTNNKDIQLNCQNGDKHLNNKKESRIEKVNRLKKNGKIFVEGNDIPDPLETFKEINKAYSVDMQLINNLTNRMSFKNLTPIQMQAIPIMLHRREILACAPTGSGKTLAFLLPVVSYCLQEKKKTSNLKALILTPTRELASQTLQVCKQLTLSEKESKLTNLVKVKMLNKTMVKRARDNNSKQLLKCDILISTPNRLVYLLNHDPPLISLSSVEWLIIDESDKLFEGGEKDTFREQLGVIYSACSSPNIRRAMFSATFAYDVQQWCSNNMDNVVEVTIGGKNTAVKSIQQKLLYTGNEQGKLIALRDILTKGFNPPVLVFVQSKERAKELFAELIYDGKNVDAIHADRTPLQRNNAVKAFRTGHTWILICTELMGRGIDFKAVNLVINYDFPNSSISYIHRIGRTGRAGRNGEAITFFTDDDKPMLRSIANVLRESGCFVPEYALKLKKLNKNDKNRFSKHQVKRETIRTTPKDILSKAKKRKLLNKNKTDNNVKAKKQKQ